VDLESRILGFERVGDLPGEMIPYVYFEFLRSQRAFRVVPIFHHNAIDILTLACLTAIVPLAFRAPEQTAFRHGADLIGLARWLRDAGRHEEASRLLRRAVDLGLPDELLFRTLWDAALLEKRQGRIAEAHAAFQDLTLSRNPYRARAFEELAKHYEHHVRDYAAALEMTRSVLALEDRPQAHRRALRLQKRLDKAASAGLSDPLLPCPDRRTLL
jgi:hypothetical protein